MAKKIKVDGRIAKLSNDTEFTRLLAIYSVEYLIDNEESLKNTIVSVPTTHH